MCNTWGVSIPSQLIHNETYVMVYYHKQHNSTHQLTPYTCKWQCPAKGTHPAQLSWNSWQLLQEVMEWLQIRNLVAL
jgi:hypothetical protein